MFEAVIGLETHIQLNTRSKIFCACKADSWGDPPNTNICPVCTGLPGVLPALNRAVVDKAARLAAAMHVERLAGESFFARKNYFSPDLPKGYQISQYDEPLAQGGHLDVPLADGGTRRVTIRKIHIEEDAGKTVHRDGRRLIDFNRCGVPLVEMVTGPDLRSADEAAQYLIRLRQLLRWVDISEADMEKGQLRCDANVSIRPEGSTYLNPKTEIKNVNSIEGVRQAVETEIARQIREQEAGRVIEAWTLEWDEDAGVLRKMRSKETEADYRYFREPDLLPIHLTEEARRQMVASLPELPLERRARFVPASDGAGAGGRSGEGLRRRSLARPGTPGPDREPGTSCAIPSRESDSYRLVCRPGYETLRWQSRSGADARASDGTPLRLVHRSMSAPTHFPESLAVGTGRLNLRAQHWAGRGA